MREFNTDQRVYVKTNNSSKKISLIYTYSLLIIFALTIILYLIFGYQKECVSLIKNFLVSLLSVGIFTYIVNVIKKKYDFSLIYTDNNILSLVLIISLFSKTNLVYVVIIASILPVIVRIINSKRNLSASLYGILFLLIYSIYFANHLYIDSDGYKLLDYLIHPNFISPILSLLAFIYIFSKKAIKYNIVLAYVLTFFLSIFLYFIINKNDILDILLVLTINSPLFLAVYVLSDYMVTPTIMETQIIYGTIMGIISAILYIIIPNLAIVISSLILPLILTNYLEKISAKLKYNSKLYYLVMTLCFIFNILAIIVLAVIL